MATLAKRFAAIACPEGAVEDYRRTLPRWQRALREVGRPVQRELIGGVTDTLTFSDGSFLTFWRVVDLRGSYWVLQ